MGKKKQQAAQEAQVPQEQQGQSGTGSRTPPAYECRIGRIKAVVWTNRTTEGEEWFSTTLTRSYKDSQGNWKSASSLGRDDLLVAAECLRAAFLFIASRQGTNLNTAPTEQQCQRQEEEVPI